MISYQYRRKHCFSQVIGIIDQLTKQNKKSPPIMDLIGGLSDTLFGVNGVFR